LLQKQRLKQGLFWRFKTALRYGWTQVDLVWHVRALRDDAIDEVRRLTPTVHLAPLDAAQRRACVLTDNKLALNACWVMIC
jgi:hypothetical protein